MKKQIARFSPHQNAKVVGILTATTAMVMLVPLFFIMSLFSLAPNSGGIVGIGLLGLVLIPIAYFLISYLSACLSCAIYNFAFKYVGGFEFESRSEQS